MEQTTKVYRESITSKWKDQFVTDKYSEVRARLPFDPTIDRHSTMVYAGPEITKVASAPGKELLIDYTVLEEEESFLGEMLHISDMCGGKAIGKITALEKCQGL